MKKSTTILSLLTLCGLAAVATIVSADGAAAVPADRAELVASLKAMSGDERRTALKAMDPAERRGLWFEVQRQLATDRGRAAATRESGAYANGGRATTGRALAPRAVGSIQYDDGVITNSFGGGALVGNRFDTHGPGNPVLDPGTVSTIQAVVVPGSRVTNSSAGFVLYGPQTTMGGANAIFSTFTAGLTGTQETVTFAGLGVTYTGASFHVLFGDFASSYVPAVGTGSTLGQGHHGLVGYTGGMAPNITGTFDFGETLNGLVRATGNILPVELMSFDIE